jgi:hypothetical protein
MTRIFCLAGALILLGVATTLVAQGPPGGRNPRGDMVAASVSKMMAFDADQDGKLSKSEITDPRLEPLFERADADKDGVVNKDELTALFKQEASTQRGGGPGFGPGFGPGGPPPGGPPGRGPRGGPEGDNPPGGPPPEGAGQFGPPGGGRGAPPRPGEVLPAFVQDQLQLTRKQRTQLEKLQQDVDARLAKILTEEQREQLNEMSRQPPGGPPPMVPRVAPPEGGRRSSLPRGEG